MGHSRRVHYASALAALVFLTGAKPPVRHRAPPAPPAELPVFTFKGIVAGQQPADTSQIENCSPDRRTCDVNFSLAGCGTIGAIDFYDTKLAGLLLMPRRACMSNVAEAFTAKYGQPTSSRNEKWENAMGASIDNGILEWRFKTGTLTLKMIGAELDYGMITYHDQNDRPPKPPRVDF